MSPVPVDVRLAPTTTITMSNTSELDRIPTNARSKALRACLLCSIVQAPQEFRRTGCPNCEEVMQVRYYHHMQQTGWLIIIQQLKGSTERITTCTTTYFDGMITVIDPERSWVARWQRTCA